MIIENMNLVDLPREDYIRCRSLNARDGGNMRDALARRKKIGCNKTKVCLVKDEAGLLLGWSLSFPRVKRRYPDTHFYVRKKYRNQGIGKILMRETLSKYKKIRVWPHNQESGVFFAEFRTSIISANNNGWLNEGEKIRLERGCSKSTHA